PTGTGPRCGSATGHRPAPFPCPPSTGRATPTASSWPRWTTYRARCTPSRGGPSSAATASTGWRSPVRRWRTSTCPSWIETGRVGERRLPHRLADPLRQQGVLAEPVVGLLHVHLPPHVPGDLHRPPGQLAGRPGRADGPDLDVLRRRHGVLRRDHRLL